MPEEKGYRSSAAKRLQSDGGEKGGGGYWKEAAQAMSSMQSGKIADEFQADDFGGDQDDEDEYYDADAPTTQSRRKVR